MVYERAVDFWKHRVCEGPNTEIPLLLIDLTLSMTTIYEDIMIEAEEEGFYKGTISPGGAVCQ
jgi:hypothetical protein